MASPLQLIVLRLYAYTRQYRLLLLALIGLMPAAHGQNFAPTKVYPAGDLFVQVNGVAVADLNGDMRPDIVTSCESPLSVGVLLNTGAGNFARPLLNFLNRSTALVGGVAVADINADGKPDIITGVFGQILILLGNGDGTFAPAVAYSLGTNTNPVGILVVDVSGDGQPDIVVADHYTNSVRILLGNQNGTFGSVVAYTAGTSSYIGGLVVADVNADGQLDVLTIDATKFAVQILLGKGGGTFETATSYSTGADSWPTSLAVGDVNGDGKLDVVTANENSFDKDGAVGVLLGSSTGTFAPVITYSTGPSSKPTSIALADVTGDGKLDIVMASNRNDYLVSVLVLKGTGDGAFQIDRFYSSGLLTSISKGASGVIIADVSGDGKPDIITANHAAGSVGVLLNTSTYLAVQPTVSLGQLASWPNPVARNMPVKFAATSLPTKVHRVEANLLSVVGQPVGHATVSIDQGVAHGELPTVGISRGLYLLQLRAYDAQGVVVGTMQVQRLLLE